MPPKSLALAPWHRTCFVLSIVNQRIQCGAVNGDDPAFLIEQDLDKGVPTA